VSEAGRGSIRTYLETFDRIITRSEQLGRRGDWYQARKKLEVLRERLCAEEANAARVTELDRARDAECTALTQVLSEALLPPVLADVIGRLMRQDEDGRRELGVWAPLDADSYLASRERLGRQAAVAEAAVRTALREHARRPSYVRVLQGLRALDDLLVARHALTPARTAAVLDDEITRLMHALLVLPEMARGLLIALAQDRLAALLARGSASQLQAEAKGGVGADDIPSAVESWRSEASTPDPFRVWFTDAAQVVYEQGLAAAAEREAARAEAEVERLAAVAERERSAREEEERQRIAVEMARECLEREREVRRVEDARLYQAELECRRRWISLRVAVHRERERLEEERERLFIEAEAKRREREDADRRETLQRVAAEKAKAAVEAERARRDAEKRAREEMQRIRREHRLRMPRNVSARNRDLVLDYLRRHGIAPSDLPSRVRDAFRREFAAG